MIGFKEKRSRGRVEPKKWTPVRISSASKAGSVLTLEFDQTVVLNGVPQYTTDVAGAAPVSAVASSPTTVEITFDAALTSATEVNIPFEDPAIRSAVGGFVADSMFPVS